MYGVTGDLAAPSYFWVDPNGNVKIRTSLRDDIATFYTLRVQVCKSQASP